MEKEFIPYEQAMALKELGFDEPCIGWYNPQVNYKKVTTDRYWAFHLTGEWENFKPSPLYQQAFRFFREKHKLDSSIALVANGYGFYVHKDRNYTNNGENYGFHITYEEAELACLNKLIEIM